MNYKKIYDDLITRALNRTLDPSIYVEKHHIVPRCLGGGNGKSNLANLTAEEHFLAHQLLVRIYPEIDSLVYAAHALTFDGYGKRVNNKLYGWLKRKLSCAAKRRNKGKKLSEETKRKLSISLKRHKRSKEHCNNISKSKLGDLNPMKGKTHSEDAKRKIGNASKGNTYASKLGKGA